MLQSSHPLTIRKQEDGSHILLARCPHCLKLRRPTEVEEDDQGLYLTFACKNDAWEIKAVRIDV